jgi:sugar lactone lactonase YvrE
MKTKVNSSLRVAGCLSGGVVCAGAVLLIASSAQAQNLFAANFIGNQIYEITPGGAQSTFATGNFPPPPETSGIPAGPDGLAFDSTGDLFVGTYGTGNIYEFTPTGVQSTFSSNLGSVFGLVFDSAGDLFAAAEDSSTGIGYIYKFTAPNGVKSTFASGLNNPTRLAINSAGDLFEADLGSGNIYEFTPTGVQSTFASGFNDPIGLAFNSAGDLFVTIRDPSGYGSASIIEIAPDGTQSTFVSGLNYYVFGLAIDSTDDLFVMDAGNIIEIAPNGTQSIFAAGVGSEGLAFQPAPELAAGFTNGAFQATVSMPPTYRSTILQISTDMVNWTSVYTNTPPFTFTDLTEATLPYRFYRALLAPTGMVPFNAPTQNVFSVSITSNVIYEITPGGAQSIFATGNFPAPGVPATPEGLAFDSAGDLFVGTYGTGNIYEFTPTGVQSTFSSNLDSVVGLVFDKAGNLFAADYGNGSPGSGNIYEFTPSGVQTIFAGGLYGPSGLAFDSAGNLYEAEWYTGSICEYTPDGIVQPFAAGLYEPEGLAFNSTGDLFVTVRNPNAYGSGSIIEITPSGVQSTFFSGLVSPVGLAIDSTDDLFVTDSGNIYKITPSGGQSTIASGVDALGLTLQPTP